MNSRFTYLEERILLDAAALSTIFVDIHSVGGDGSSWSQAYNNLQSALDQASHTNGKDQIWVADGTYLPTREVIPGDLNSKSFVIYDASSNGVSDGISIYGGFKGNESKLSQSKPDSNVTILSADFLNNDLYPSNPEFAIQNQSYLNSKADNARHVVTISQPNLSVTLDGLTITKGFASLTYDPVNFEHAGAGILAVKGGTNLTLNHVIIRENSGLTFSENTPNPEFHFPVGAGFALIDPAFFDTNLHTNLNTLLLTDSLLEKNLTNPFHVLGGVGLILNGTSTVDNIILQNNVIGHGGLFFAGGEVLIKHSLFKGNVGETGGGVQIGDEYHNVLGEPTFSTIGTVKDSIFKDNTGTQLHGSYGIGLSSVISDLNVSKSTFINNISGAGALSTFDSNLTVRDSVFLNNGARNIGEIFGVGGGAISTFEGSLIVKNSYFKENFAEGMFGDGGAIQTGSTEFVISDNQFIKNRALGFGGAIANFLDGDGSIENNLFVENSASFGGAYASLGFGGDFVGRNITIQNSIFRDNRALADGGAVFLQENGDFLFKDSQFIHNVSDRLGGAVAIGTTLNFAVPDPVHATIKNSLFKDNQAKGLSTLSPETQEQIDFKISIQYSTDAHLMGGGAIFNANELVVSNSNFINNKALNGGAISSASFSSRDTFFDQMVIYSSSSNISHSEFKNNTAFAGDGGAILEKGWSAAGFEDFGTITALIKDNSFINNQASQKGGGVAGENSSSLIVRENTFKNNKAGTFGGHLSVVDSSDQVITSAEVKQNGFNQGDANINGDKIFIDHAIINGQTTQAGIFNTLKVFNSFNKIDNDDIYIQ